MNARSIAGIALIVSALVGGTYFRAVRMGKQADGAYIVSTGQRVEGDAIAFDGRPSDLALHPGGDFVAVMSKMGNGQGGGSKIFLVGPSGILADSEIRVDAAPGFHGLLWTPDGKTLLASMADGKIHLFGFDGKLAKGDVLDVGGANPVPGGMAITRDGRYLYVAAVDLNAVVEFDLVSKQRLRQIPVEQMPFTVALSDDESKLIVSNWGGRYPQKDDRTALSENNSIVVDERGVPSTGTVSIVDRATGHGRSVAVGLHPTDIAVKGDSAYVANALSDTISEVDVASAAVRRTIPIRWNNLKVLGAMPNALAIRGDTLYACDGGDNAVCQVDLPTGQVRGFRHAGYFPIAIALAGERAYVLNSKGYGSVANTMNGKNGNAHDFEGTVTLVDLSKDLGDETQVVAKDNDWKANPAEYRPKLAVYNGAIQHVLYIIKENRTYDQIFGDMPEGNGDPKLCSIGPFMPNHQAIAREFTLFDNGYVSGTNSADGHQWCDQALANDYMEHNYVNYSRTYPDDGSDAMALSGGGAIWDAAAKKHKTIRDYGEFTDYDIAEYRPYKPKDWFEAWDDRQNGTHKFTYIAHTAVAGLRPYIDPHYHYWPLIMSDQARADEFIREFTEYSRKDQVPNLMVMSLPSDHTEGMDQNYPQPKSMMADNDLALGRIVEAVSKSPQWKNTCIFVIEDDAQAGEDHVDGHRTSFMVISAYNKRHTVDSNFYTTINMVRSIEMMLGLDPMNKFDAGARPIDTCFNDTPDLTPYIHVPNAVPLGLRNPSPKALDDEGKFWYAKSESLDWSHEDGPDPYWLNRVIWYSIKGSQPYPARQGDQPGAGD